MLLMSLMAALAVAQPAAQPAALAEPAGPGAEAVLVEPRALTQVFDGRSWTCDEAGKCVGRGGGANQPLMRECRRFVARLGPVSAYARAGQALTEAELIQCNTAAGH